MKKILPSLLIFFLSTSLFAEKQNKDFELDEPLLRKIELSNIPIKGMLSSMGVGFSYPTQLVFSFGYSTPTNIYDSYGSDGFAFKLSIEQPMAISEKIKYSMGWQNISFSENIISYNAWNGLIVREGEKANLFDIGIKFMPINGLGRKIIFKPYVAASFGIGFFRQYTEYDYPDTYEDECNNFWNILFHIIFSEDCDVETNQNINTEIDSRMVSPFMTVDLGTSIKLFKSDNYNIEFGIRYNMISNIQASDWSQWDQIEDQKSFNDILEKKINADYKSIYLGFSFPMKSNKK